MTENEMLEKIKELVCIQLENIEPESIKPETHFIRDLEADSLDVVELVMRVEDDFDVVMNDRAASKFLT